MKKHGYHITPFSFQGHEGIDIKAGQMTKTMVVPPAGEDHAFEREDLDAPHLDLR